MKRSILHKFLFVPVVSVSCFLSLFSQEKDLTDNVLFSLLLEEITEQTENEEETMRLLEDLGELRKNPLNINKANINEMRKLFFLNDFQINSIIRYREEYGYLRSINELQLVPGISNELIQKLNTYISVSDPDPSFYRHSKKYVKNDLIIRLKQKFEIPAGFTNDIDSMKQFHGSRVYFLARNELTLNPGARTGILIEKDPGEPFFSGFNKNKPDHFSGYVEIKRDKILKKLIIGDYKAGFGQGLTAGCTFISKSSNAMILPGKDELKKSLSASESGYLRGLAAETVIGKAHTSFFLSSLYRDAKLNHNITVNDSLIYFSAIRYEGFHRNPDELSYQNTIRQFNAGAGISRNFKNLTIGIAGVYTSFNHPKEISVYHPEIVPPGYRSDYLNLGINYRLNLGQVIFFGEWAYDYGFHSAILNGLMAQLHPLVTLSAVHRKYSPEYISFLSSSFGKTSSASNEEGFYIGVNIDPFPFLNLSCYADHYSFPWLKQNMPQPYAGNDYYLNAIVTINEENNITFRYRTTNQQMKTSRNETGIDLAEKYNSVSRRLCYNYTINESLKLETRYEQTGFSNKENSEQGYYLGQKIILKPVGKKFAVWLSYGLFDVSDWRNRIYVYEHDVLYDFAIPAMYREGSRFSIMIKARILKYCEVWYKFYISLYERSVERGSGADMVCSGTDSGMKIQLRISL